MWVLHHTLSSSRVLPCSEAVLSPAVRQSEQGTEASSCCRKIPIDNVRQLLGESSGARRIIRGLNVCFYKWVRIDMKSGLDVLQLKDLNDDKVNILSY